MSFILDAIARSEQERQQQQAPDARRLAFPASSPVRTRSATPYLVTGALLLAIAVLAAIWIQSPRPPGTPFVGSGGSAVPAVPEAAGEPAAPVDSRDTPSPAPAEDPKPGAAAQMLADAAAGSTVEPAAQPMVDEDELAAALDPSLAASATRSSDQAARADTAESAAVVPASPPQPEATRRRVSRLSDLPADVRRVLPSVVFTGHLYSRNPRASYVFISDGRQVVAGQQITDDLVLDEITPTGVVVEFQGYLIEVGVLQNWSLK